VTTPGGRWAPRAARALQRLWMRRRASTGRDFVNSVLDATGQSALDATRYAVLREELAQDAQMAAQYERHIPRLAEISAHKKIANWPERLSRAEAQIDIFFVLPRVLRPTTVVETGVASGSMTSFLLAALHRNEHGHLFSFDIMPKSGQYGMNWTANGEGEVGFLIPERYRDRWSLTFADATYAMPRQLEGKLIDCFFHDSDHSFDHMMFEYAFAAKHLSPGGCIISDDITMTEAFARYFGVRTSVFIHKSNPNIGIAVPRHDR
jgi:predicted O-methyltransferase YrrM